MTLPQRPLSPFMQYRWLYTNTLSILHRLTGILLSAGFLLLVYWLVAAARGPESYERGAVVPGVDPDAGRARRRAVELLLPLAERHPAPVLGRRASVSSCASRARAAGS